VGAVALALIGSRRYSLERRNAKGSAG
jgi:hypothetical protein